MTLGKKLRFLRDRTDKNREEISKALNIKYSTYANYENDMRQPDLETIKIIAAYFNTSTDYLLGLTDDKKRTAELHEEKSSYGKMTDPIKKVVIKMEDLPLDYQEKILAMVNLITESNEKDKNKHKEG